MSDSLSKAGLKQQLGIQQLGNVQCYICADQEDTDNVQQGALCLAVAAWSNADVVLRTARGVLLIGSTAITRSAQALSGAEYCTNNEAHLHAMHACMLLQSAEHIGRLRVPKQLKYLCIAC